MNSWTIDTLRLPCPLGHPLWLLCLMCPLYFFWVTFSLALGKRSVYDLEIFDITFYCVFIIIAAHHECGSRPNAPLGNGPFSVEGAQHIILKNAHTHTHTRDARQLLAIIYFLCAAKYRPRDARATRTHKTTRDPQPTLCPTMMG